MSLTTTSSIPVGSWQVDPVHSTVTFAVEHNGLVPFRGQVREVSGALDVTQDGARLAGSAAVEAIDVQQADLRGHLLAPDFFDAARHPTLRFGADHVEFTDDGAVRVAGDLTIKGTTLPIEAVGRIDGPVTDGYGNERYALALTTVVDRTKFGLGWNMELPGGRKVLGDDVTIDVALELVGA